MPIEIRELIIKAKVEQGPQPNADNGRRGKSESKYKMLAAQLRDIQKIIREKNER